MSEGLERGDEALLRSVVLGELAADAPEVVARAARSPALARALAEWRRVDADLRSVTEEERADLARVDAEQRAEDRAAVRAAVAARVVPARRRRPALVALVLAAAAAVALFLLVRGPREPERGWLGGDERCATPLGEVDAFDVFAIRGTLAPGQTLEVRVSDDGGREVRRSPTLDRTEWRPEPEERAAIERLGSLRWSYVIRAGPDVVESGGPCAASLRR